MTAVEPDLTAGTAVEAARHYRERGWRPFPLDHPSTPRCSGLHRPERPCEGGERRGKHPCVAYGTATASEATDKTLEWWFGNGPRNIGIACGPSGLLVIDEDEPNALSMLAADLGEDLPKTYRVRTARGWHWYFEAPTDVELGNRSGRLAEYHIDVRGGRGKGGYVVAAGSTHHTGHIYEAEDLYALPAPLPRWLIPEIQASPAGPAGATGDGQGAPGAWDDAPRYGAEHDLREQYRRHLDAVRSRNGEFRHELFNAARDAWRLHNLGLLDMPTMAEDLRQAVIRVWQDEPDGNDKLIVNEQARDAAAASPWVVLGPTSAPAGSSPAAGAALASEGGFKFPGLDLDPAQVAEINAEAAAMEEAARFESDVAYALRQRQVRREAERREAELDRAGRPALVDDLIDVTDLDQVQPPRMILGSLLPELAVGFLAGRSGAYKSFVAVGWACSLAAGRPWLDRAEFAVDKPLRVLYVAAEGAAGVAQRIRSWQAANGKLSPGTLTLYPKPIRLNDDGHAAELAALVAERGIEHVFIDTYRRSAPGTEENSATEFGRVFDAVAVLRDEHGCGTTFLDHTGHVGGRPRGTSAKGDDADYVLTLDYEGLTREAHVQRTLRVLKLKDTDTVGEWPIKLRPVVDGLPPVAEVGEVTDAQGAPFGLSARWWDLDGPQVPAEVLEKLTGEGRESARDVFRVLRHIGERDGLTPAQIRQSLDEGPRKHSRTAVFAALAMLKDRQITEEGLSSSRHALAHPWGPR